MSAWFDLRNFPEIDGRTYTSFGMIKLNTPGKPPLSKEAQLGYYELIDLVESVWLQLSYHPTICPASLTSLGMRCIFT